MSIQVTCRCGKRLAVADGAEAKKVRCPRCHERVAVPQSSPTEEVDEKDESDSTEKHKQARKRKSSKLAKSSLQKRLVFAGAALAVVAVLTVCGIKGVAWLQAQKAERIEREVRTAVADLANQLRAEIATVPNSQRARAAVLDELKREQAALDLEKQKGLQPVMTKIVRVGPGGKVLQTEMGRYALYLEKISALQRKANEIKVINETILIPLVRSLGRIGSGAKEAEPIVQAALPPIWEELKRENAALAVEKQKGWRFVYVRPTTTTTGRVSQRGKVFDDQQQQSGGSYWQANSGETSDRDPRAAYEQRIAVLKSVEEATVDALREMQRPAELNAAK